MPPAKAVARLLCGLAAAAAFDSKTVAASNQSSVPTVTSPTPTSNHPTSCCFVVQDTISEYYWKAYTVYPIWETIEAITRNISVFPTGNVTNYATNTRVQWNPTFTGEYPWSYPSNPLRLPPFYFRDNYATGPTTDVTALGSENGTAIATGGITVRSPAAFDVYNSLKIIVVPPVTDQFNNVVCATPSLKTGGTDADYEEEFGKDLSRTFTNINSYAEAYYGTASYPNVGGEPAAEPATSPDLATITAAPSVAAVITFTTPYVRVAPASETVSWKPCNMDPKAPQELWGYVPQDVIDMVVSEPAYSTQYPGIASCLPGGPSILVNFVQLCPFPGFSNPERTLTQIVENVITPSVSSDFFVTPLPPSITKSPQRPRTQLPVEDTSTTSPAPSPQPSTTGTSLSVTGPSPSPSPSPSPPASPPQNEPDTRTATDSPPIPPSSTNDNPAPDTSSPNTPGEAPSPSLPPSTAISTSTLPAAPTPSSPAVQTGGGAATIASPLHSLYWSTAALALPIILLLIL